MCNSIYVKVPYLHYYYVEHKAPPTIPWVDDLWVDDAISHIKINPLTELDSIKLDKNEVENFCAVRFASLAINCALCNSSS